MKFAHTFGVGGQAYKLRPTKFPYSKNWGKTSNFADL